MTVIRPSLPGGSSIFCDDVRFETNGKQIYIGVYPAEMLVSPGFPATLPVFHVVIQYRELVAEDNKDPLYLVVLNTDGGRVFEYTIERKIFPLLPADFPPPDEDGADPMRLVTVIAALPGLRIPKEGRIEVRAYRGEDEIWLGGLEVKLNPQAQPQSQS
jgi:hypothetical protein